MELFEIAAASEDRAFTVFVAQQSEQQMLQADIFMPAGFGFFESSVKRRFEIFANHCLRLFQRAFQWIFMLARQVFDQRDFGFRDFVSIDAGDADAFFVDMEHDLQRFSLLFVKDILQDLHDELLSSVIVVMQQYFIKRRPFDLFLGLGDYRSDSGSLRLMDSLASLKTQEI